MNQKKQLTIKEFSRLTGIKRENLRFYDRIGLLSPERRGANNYRYYSRHQLSTAYLITDLRGLGVGIQGIKHYAAQSTPENTLALFAQQEQRIQAELRQLHQTSAILHMHTEMIQQALDHQGDDVFLQQQEAQPIFLCPPVPPHMDDDEGGIFSYDYAEAHGVNLGFPQGCQITLNRQDGAGNPAVVRYYFKTGEASTAEKAAGLYAVAYGWCDPWESGPIYMRLMSMIRDRGLRIMGDAYEEYPLSDATQNGARSCIRVEIPVAED